jgi:hypothetical protein
MEMRFFINDSHINNSFIDNCFVVNHHLRMRPL